MSKFYTNIEVRGNNILYMGWENGIPIKKKVPYKPHLFVKAKDGVGPVVAFGTKEALTPIEFESISDMKDYVKKYSDVENFQMYGCSDVVRQYTASEFSGEIQWDYQLTKIWFFDIETRVEGIVLDGDEKVSVRFQNDVRDLSHVQIMRLLKKTSAFEIYQNNEWISIKESEIYRAGFPDSALAEQEILLISMMDHHAEKIHVWSAYPIREDNPIFDYSVDFRSFESEKEMLKDFIMFWKSTRIDILSGWNSEKFDVPYLINRLKKILGDSLTAFMSPWNVVKERIFKEEEDEFSTYDMYGITHLDYLEIYKKFNPGSKESFKLDYIAEYELGKKKVENPTDSFKDFYNEHWETFVHYNVIDTHLLHELEKKMLQIRLAMQIAYIARCNFGDVVSAMRVWESIIYNYFLGLNIAEDYNKKIRPKKQIVGAYVHEPKRGKYGWTISIDATSLYPSIMMQNNISPECIVGKLKLFIDDLMDGKHEGLVPDGQILSANGLLTTKEFEGFIPILVRRMFDLRKVTKNRMLDLKKANAPEDDVKALDVAQSAYKVSANSFYGIMGLPYFKYYDPDMAEAVTATGQVFIKKTKQFMDEMMGKLVGKSGEYAMYCDTDSAYINMDDLVKKHCKGKTDQQIVDYLENFVFKIIQPELNKKLAVVAKSMGIDDCKISFKLECIGPSLIMCVKKKYMFDILYSEGVRYNEPKMKVMGIEIVRSSTPSVVKEYLKKAAKICLSGDESQLHTYVKQVKEDFMKLDYTQASFPRGCNGMKTYASKTSIYGFKTPSHVKGALLYNHYLRKNQLHTKYPLVSDGEKIKYVHLKKMNPIHETIISFPDRLPVELDLVKYIDWDTQFEKAFLKPLEAITDSIGWHTEPIATLDSFFD